MAKKVCKIRRNLVRARIMVPMNVSETVAISPLPERKKTSCRSCVCYKTQTRYKESVELVPYFTPVMYSESVFCDKDSTQTRYKSSAFFETRVRPKHHGECRIIYPKHTENKFVSTLDYHLDGSRQWFTTKLDFDAKTVRGDNDTTPSDSEDEYEVTGGEKVNGYSEYDNLPLINGPDDGATEAGEKSFSQVLLPRFNRDGAVSSQATAMLADVNTSGEREKENLCNGFIDELEEYMEELNGYTDL